MDDPAEKSEDEWQRVLDPHRFRILRQAGTESAFSGVYWDHKAQGIYACAGCHAPLFASTTKFDSGSGWPSFSEPLDATGVEELRDETHGMVRIEVRCARCKGHLGHVFPDGPNPSGMRYCINSASLDFEA